MSELPLVEWDHGLFGELFTLLGRVATQPVNPPLRRLQARLEDAKPWLLALTNAPGPNDADKTKVANGKLRLPCMEIADSQTPSPYLMGHQSV
jgi:hypothetical protein